MYLMTFIMCFYGFILQGFVLDFEFAPNDYFTNTVLSKSYEMRYEPDPEDPFAYEGPEIIKCSG